jgi:DNA-binding GntR family transcriptional regulator
MACLTTILEIEHAESPAAPQAIPPVHGYLRRRVLDGTLRPGVSPSQSAIARQLGVGRTPLREVPRILHDEGLVAAEPNQRTRVTELTPQELDDTYAGRILLETLAVSMTMPSFGAARHEEATQLLNRMRKTRAGEDLEGWFDAHAEYRAVLTAASGEAMQRQLSLMADRTARYIRVHQLTEATWQTADEAEHERILEALLDGRLRDALVGIAHHLARTARRVIGDYAPDYEPVAIPRAVDIVDGLPVS